MDEEVSHVTSSKKRGPKPKGAGPHNVEALDDIEGATGTRPGFTPYDREEE